MLMVMIIGNTIGEVISRSFWRELLSPFGVAIIYRVIVTCDDDDEAGTDNQIVERSYFVFCLAPRIRGIAKVKFWFQKVVFCEDCKNRYQKENFFAFFVLYSRAHQYGGTQDDSRHCFNPR